jgi:hypothetical protein
VDMEFGRDPWSVCGDAQPHEHDRPPGSRPILKSLEPCEHRALWKIRLTSQALRDQEFACRLLSASRTASICLTQV